MRNKLPADAPRTVAAQAINDSLVITGDFNQVSMGAAAAHACLAPTLPAPPRQPPWDDAQEYDGQGSRLLDILDPAAGALPFVGREAALADLQAWLAEPAPVSVHALTGPAGIGKTRLALQLCLTVAARADERWIAGFVAPADLAIPPPDTGWPLPCLLVVDYAAQCGPGLRYWLDRLTRRPPPCKLRLLLLERDADRHGLGWWHDLAGTALHGAQPRHGLFRTGDPAPLGALDALEDRRRLMQAALAAARARCPEDPVDSPDAPRVPAPGECPGFDTRLRRRRFASPLAVVMAGLIARERGASAALSLRHLDSARLLGRREIDRLVALAAARGVAEDTARLALALHLLTGGLQVATARTRLATLLAPYGQADRAGAAALLLAQYFPPPESPPVHDDARLPVIQPDLIGSAAILETLSAGSILDAEAPGLILAAYSQDPDGTARVLVRLAQDFAFATAARGTTNAERDTARRILRWLEGLAHAIDEPPRLIPLARAMPPQTTVLRALAAEIAGTLAQHFQARMVDAPSADAAIGAATWTNHLAIRLSDLGYRDAALAAAEESVRLRRALLAATPGSPAADLAKALNTLAAMQSDSRHPTAALATAEEAGSIYRALATAQPDAFGPELAMSLSNHAALLSGAARREAAWEVGREATRLYRRLAAQQPGLFAPDLAMSLNNGASILVALNQVAPARALAEEAVRLYRVLADDRPDAHTPDLTTALETLGRILTRAGEAAAARAVYAEAIARLTPAFRALPLAFRARMEGFVEAYRRQCEAAGQAPDPPLLDLFPIQNPTKENSET